MKKYLDYEGLKYLIEKIKTAPKDTDSNSLSVEIVSKDKLGEVKNNSIIFVRK